MDQRVERRLLAGTAAAAVAAGLAGIAGATRLPADAGPLTGMAVTGVSALLAGAAIVAVVVTGPERHRPRLRRLHPGEHARLQVGFAFAVWGVGQVLIAADAGAEGWAFDTGYACGTIAAGVVTLAVLHLPRRSRLSRPALRLALDALLFSFSALAAVWWGVLRPALPDPDAPGGVGILAAAMACFDLIAAALLTLLWLRDRRRGGLILAVGGALQAAADISSLPDVINGQLFPWGSDALWCLAWPLLGLGMIRLHTVPRSGTEEMVLEDLGESTSTTVVTLVGIAVLAGLLASPGHVLSSGVDAVVLGTMVTLLVVREIVDNRIRRRLVIQLGEETLRDALTGLPNRRALTRRIRALDLTRPWSLLTIDLDAFREINDLLGTRAGDDLIVAVGRVLSERIPEGAVIARIGGDEFGVLAPGDVDTGRELAASLARAVRASSASRADGLPVTVSIGVGRLQVESPGATPETALDDGEGAGADVPDGAAAPVVAEGPARPRSRQDRLAVLVESGIALRSAQADGRDSIAVYPGAVAQARERGLVVERRLRGALAEANLTMHAQPLVDLRTGEVQGFESLARWTDAELGPVSPAEFVAVAERAGLVVALGDFALRSSLEEALAGGVIEAGVEVGVNVSPIQLRVPGFAAAVRDLADELEVLPLQLTLEVTEAILIDEDDPARSALAELAAAGFRLAIDDFGTGYSALNYLRRLPLNILKIDRSWVVEAVGEPRTRSVVSGVIGLAHELGAAVVMEGIEDADVARMCRDLGADIGQGWHFGRPAPWSQALATVERSRSAVS